MRDRLCADVAGKGVGVARIDDESARRNAAARGSRASSIAGAFFAAPVAKIIKVSDVDVSLSTVIALNERSTDFDSIGWSAPDAIGASVKT